MEQWTLISYILYEGYNNQYKDQSCFFLIDIGYDDLLLVLKYFLSAGFFLFMDLLSDHLSYPCSPPFLDDSLVYKLMSITKSETISTAYADKRYSNLLQPEDRPSDIRDMDLRQPYNIPQPIPQHQSSLTQTTLHPSPYKTLSQQPAT